MDVEHINPFIQSAINVFGTMLNCPIQRNSLSLKENDAPTYEISGVIGLSGPVSGSVVFSLSREVAFHIAEGFLMEQVSEITAEVVDAVGEVTNMIAGGAKKELSQYALSLGLPTVIVGRNHTITFPKDVKPICVEFTTPWGPISLEVGLAENAEAAAPQPAVAASN